MKSRFLKLYLWIFLVIGIFTLTSIVYEFGDPWFAALIIVQLPTLIIFERGFDTSLDDQTWFTVAIIVFAFLFTPFVWSSVLLGLMKLFEVIRGKIRKYGR